MLVISLRMGLFGSAPSFLRTVRLVAVASAIAATASAAVVFALVRQPAAEESIAARTLVQSVDQAPPTGRAPVAARNANPGRARGRCRYPAANEFGDPSAHPRAPSAVALAEAPSMMANEPPTREASEIFASPVREAGPSLKPPSKKPRLTSRDERPVVAAIRRIARARQANRPASTTIPPTIAWSGTTTRTSCIMMS